MNVVKYGMEGYLVKLLQYALWRAGLEVGNLDGIYGRRTARALQQFQRERGLSADGVAGKLTWAALYPYLPGYTLHRVVPGDTFFELAKAYGTTVSAIWRANPAVDPEALQVGSTLIIPLDLPVVTDTMPCSSLLIGLMIQGLVKRYPSIQTCEIGRSVMGRPIPALSLGSGKRQVGYTAAHHADEWTATLVMLRFLEEYAAACAASGTIGGIPAQELYEAVTLHMVPLVNPDGVDLVTGALDPLDSFYVQAEALAAHYPNIPFPEGWKSNISGVDLELQYPTGWERIRRIRFTQGYTRPGPRGYVGSEPLTAPESRALAQWTKKRDFSRTLSCRTGSAGRDGYAAWFTETFRRPGQVMELGAGESADAPCSAAYEKALHLLIRGLIFSP